MRDPVLADRELLLAAHRAEFLEESQRTHGMTEMEAKECLSDFERETLNAAREREAASPTIGTGS